MDERRDREARPYERDGEAFDVEGYERLQRVAPPRGRAPSAPLVAIASVLAIVLAVAKPWVSPVAPGASTSPPALGSAALTPALTPPAAPPPVTAESAAMSLCFGVDDWRVVAAETWNDQTVRAWIAADGQVAQGQLDPRLVFTPVVGRAVPSIGFCAPVAGQDRPPDDAEVSIWRLDRGSAFPLSPTVREPPTATPFGRLWWPPTMFVAGGATTDGTGGTDGASAIGTWPAGRYVVGIARAPYVRWLGIEVILSGAR